MPIELDNIRCFSCGAFFGIEHQLHEERLKDGCAFTCPNGHAQSFIGPSENEKLRAEVERLKSLSEERLRRVEVQGGRLAYGARRIAALQGRITKLLKKYEPERFGEE